MVQRDPVIEAYLGKRGGGGGGVTSTGRLLDSPRSTHYGIIAVLRT